ncbi:uncharacterized protein LOC134747388 [Cydia strobilella]|uniref:uncharacterized protein LOC134747388 n=1 Tax=Cydia strobilella TaxID=1100964 RepID=UPI003005CA68
MAQNDQPKHFVVTQPPEVNNQRRATEQKNNTVAIKVSLGTSDIEIPPNMIDQCSCSNGVVKLCSVKFNTTKVPRLEETSSCLLDMINTTTKISKTEKIKCLLSANRVHDVAAIYTLATAACVLLINRSSLFIGRHCRNAVDKCTAATITITTTTTTTIIIVITATTAATTERKKKRKGDDTLNEAYEIIKSAKKKMDEVSNNEFDIYGQYVASELKNVKDQRARMQAKYYINNILQQARMGYYNSGGYGEWYGYGSGYRTASSTSTYADTSTPTGTPEPGEAHNANSQDVLHFSNLEELISQLEYDDSQ